jgi:hypothetical protein
MTFLCPHDSPVTKCPFCGPRYRTLAKKRDGGLIQYRNQLRQQRETQPHRLKEQTT